MKYRIRQLLDASQLTLLGVVFGISVTVGTSIGAAVGSWLGVAVGGVSFSQRAWLSR